MCFSAEASFTAAAVLGIVGYKTVSMATARAQMPLALLPWLFGFHQLMEGILWVYFSQAITPDGLFYLAQVLYIVYAYMFILIWVPLSALVLEPPGWRRQVMKGFLCTAVVLAALNVDKLVGAQAVVRVVHHSLQYPETSWVRGLPYIVVICSPLLFSSRPRVWWMGALGLVTTGIAMYFYYWTFASVWCFFAGIISISIYWILIGLNDKQNATDVRNFQKND